MGEPVRLTAYSHGAGCACKLGISELAQVLRHVPTQVADPAVLVGLEIPDDSGVYQVTPDLALVQSVDFFTPIVDDPYAWGRIAATNALSDIYAMGARPRTALNLVAWPRTLDFELLGRVLEGAAKACDEASVAILGGHSIDDEEPKFGLAVTGTVQPDRIVTTAGARPGCRLVLTKPLGTGVISTALKQQRAPEDVVGRAVEIMSTLNRTAADAMVAVGVESATDVTGFGLVGHLREMLGTTLSATLHYDNIPFIPGAKALADEGFFPGGSRRNEEATARFVDSSDLDDIESRLLFDAQTSGGLLIAVVESKVEALISVLRESGVSNAAIIGRVEQGDGRILVRR